MPNGTPHPPDRLRLRLFIVGTEPHSRMARDNIERVLAEEHFRHLELEVVDVLHDYRAALDNSILIAPTLVITVGESRVTVAGDMSDLDKIRTALEMI